MSYNAQGFNIDIEAFLAQTYAGYERRSREEPSHAD